MSSDLNSHLPLYAQVENVIISRISNGSLPPGTRLPSEESLVQEYAVSRTTIRAAIQSLVQRGLVEIRRGKGTFVTHPKITQELTELTGFVEDMQALGRHATAKVLDQQVVAATQVVARQLALPQGAPVVRIERVRLGDGIPLSFDQTYLPKELGEKVMADHIGRTSSLASLTRHHISGTRPFMFPRLIWPNATPSGNLANALTRQRRHSSGPKMLQFDLEQVRGFGATGWEMAVVFGCSLKMIQKTRKQTESGA